MIVFCQTELHFVQSHDHFFAKQNFILYKDMIIFITLFLPMFHNTQYYFVSLPDQIKKDIRL